MNIYDIRGIVCQTYRGIFMECLLGVGKLITDTYQLGTHTQSLSGLLLLRRRQFRPLRLALLVDAFASNFNLDPIRIGD